jgi:hypothetical protein
MVAHHHVHMVHDLLVDATGAILVRFDLTAVVQVKGSNGAVLASNFQGLWHVM